MSKKENIGVAGLGDLGVPLVAQIFSSGESVDVVDRGVCARDVCWSSAVDPAVSIEGVNVHGGVRQLDNLEVLVKDSDVVHWAIPSSSLDGLPLPNKEDQMVVLHDSVMQNSEDAIRMRPDTSRFVIAHCLMNTERTVVVSPEHGDPERAMMHFKEIGLRAVSMSVDEHDLHMAETQGRYALLIVEDLLNLRRQNMEGLLTPSSKELLAALEHRKGQWSDATLRSILANPHLAVDPEKVDKFFSDRPQNKC